MLNENLMNIMYLHEKWFNDCLDSAEYCLEKGDFQMALKYVDRARYYLKCLKENYPLISEIR